MHQGVACPAMENECFVVEPSAVKLIFRWSTERSLNGQSVHIILSDVDSQIKLIRNASSEKYESEVVSILPGKYYGQIVLGHGEIHPLRDIDITKNTKYAEIKVEKAQYGQLVVADSESSQLMNDEEPRQMQTKEGSAYDTGILVNMN